MEAAKLHRRKYTERKRHNGVIFITVILWVFAACACAVLILSVANSTAAEHNWQTNILRRDNIASQASVLAEAWFTGNLNSGSLFSASEFETGAAPRSDPYIPLPSDMLTILKKSNPLADINVSIIDQNYSGSVASSMDKLGVPFTGPLMITSADGASSQDIYGVKYFQLRASVALNDLPDDHITLVRNFAVLQREDGTYQAICICTKKQ